MKKLKGIAIVLVLVAVFCMSVPSQIFARLIAEGIQKINTLLLEPYDNSDPTLSVTCVEGGSGSTSSYSCSCHNTATSNKNGAIRVNVNGSDRWIRTYDGPQ